MYEIILASHAQLFSKHLISLTSFGAGPRLMYISAKFSISRVLSWSRLSSGMCDVGTADLTPLPARLFLPGEIGIVFRAVKIAFPGLLFLLGATE